MQLWLKKILKLNLKLRVRKTTGEAEESEGEDIPDDLLKADPADARCQRRRRARTSSCGWPSCSRRSRRR